MKKYDILQPNPNIMSQKLLTEGDEFRIETEPAPYRKVNIHEITKVETVNESLVIDSKIISGTGGPIPRDAKQIAVPIGTTIEQIEQGTYFD